MSAPLARPTATLVGFSAVLLWSLLAFLTAASGTMPAFQLTAITFAVGGLSLLLIRPASIKAMRQPPKVWLLGVGGLFGYHFAYFFALRSAPPAVYLGPATTDRDRAAVWFDHFEGAGLDGVIAKALDGPYREGERAMVKVKHKRTADCVVAGTREHKQGGVGSLLLGLYDRAGTLHHVGVASSFAAPLRAQLTDDLAPFRDRALDGHPWADWAEWAAPDAVAPGRMPGGQSRWTGGKDLSWDPVRPERVVEVAYEHVQRVGGSPSVEAGRFRHTARFVRWRPDRDPSSCRYDQLDEPLPAEFPSLFASGAAKRRSD